MTEPKSSRTVKGKIISRSKGEFQDSDKSDSLKPASKVPECPYTDEKLYEAYCAGQNSLISADWESPSEVEALIKDERAKVLKEIIYKIKEIPNASWTVPITVYALLQNELDNLKQGVKE